MGMSEKAKNLIFTTAAILFCIVYWWVFGIGPLIDSFKNGL